jgi:hypothetical protein
MQKSLRTLVLAVFGVLFLITPALAMRPAPAATTQIYLPLMRSSGPSNDALSSEALIAAAVADGTLNEETALIYRIYATFADERLPAVYRGNDTAVTYDGRVLEQAATRWETLTAAAQAIVLPFLTPPAYSGSWAGEPAAVLAADRAPLCGGLTANWMWVDTTNGRARIWWQDSHPGDAKQARMLAEQFDTVIWPKVRNLMGRDNLSDAEKSCNGLDGRLDIYLADMPGANPAKGWNITYPPSCNTAATFIQLNRTLPTNELRSALAHELLHAFQWAFKSSALCDRDEDRWWREATATWVMHFVYPNDNLEHSYAEYLLKHPDVSLERFSSETDMHPYGAYLLPFYMAQTYSSALIRTSWEKLSTHDSLEAVNTALPGGFAEIWPKFVLHNWNAAPAPYDSYTTWDGVTERAVPVSDTAVPAPNGQQTYALPVEVAHLASEYYRFTFPDDNARGITFYNGITFNATEITADGGRGLGMAPLSEAERVGANVQALIKIDGQWHREDWTERPIVFFCRDQKSQRIEELVLVFSNSSHDQERIVQPLGEAPVLAVSNAGCWKWQGTASVRIEAHDYFTKSWMIEEQQANITWERFPPIVDPVDDMYLQLDGYRFKAHGTVAWNYEEELYDADPPDHILCRHEGNATLPLGNLGHLNLSTGGILVGRGEREYSGNGRAMERGVYTRECYATAPSTGSHELVYWHTGDGSVYISADGRRISGSYEEDCSDEFRACIEKRTWEFRAVRE